MTEAELIYQLSVLNDSWWSLIEWWAGISFGLLAMTNFFGKQLKLPFVVITLSIYVAFSFTVAVNLSRLANLQSGTIESLGMLGVERDLSLLGEAVMDGTKNFVWRVGIPFVVSILGTFLGTISYVIYGYRVAHRES